MEILIYTHVFPPMVGGIETITMELARRLSDSARSIPGDTVQVTLVTPKAEPAPHENELPFRIVRKPSFMHLARLIRRADILHVSGTAMLPLFLGWLLRKRIVVGHHGFQTVCPNGDMVYSPTQLLCPGHYMAGRHLQCWKCNAGQGAIHSLKLWSLTFPRRWFCTRANANVVPTRALGSVLQLPNLVTIHLGLDVVRSSATEQEAGPRSVAFIGRLVSTKGVHILLQAVHQLSDCELRVQIIGDGPECKRLEADVRSLGLENRVFFRGYLPPDEVEQTLTQAPIVVLPSFCETFGLVALENMAREKVLIVSAIGPLTEVIGDAGLSFPVGDAKALADCIERVLKSEELREQISTRAVERAHSLFTTQRMVDSHRLLYRRILDTFLPNRLSFGGKES